MSAKQSVTAECSEQDAEKQHATHTPQQANARDATNITYAEGGWTAWTVVLGSWLALFGSMSLMNSIGVFQAYILRNQLREYSVDEVGWIFGVYSGLTFFCGVLVGPVFDARGPRELISLGGIGTVLFLVLLGFCKRYWEFMLVFGVLGGVSLSLTFGPAISIVAHYFNERRGLATGIASSGGSFGGIVFPIMLERLFSKFGFAWATRAAAILCFVTFTASVLLIRPRFPPKPLTMATVRPSLRPLLNPGLALTSLGVFFMEWGIFVPFSYLTSYALDNKTSPELAYALLSVANAGGVLGRWVTGYLADRFGRFNMLIATMVGGVLTNACLWMPAGSSGAVLVVFALLFGFCSGGNVSLAPVCVGQLCDVKSYGRWYGTAFMLVSVRFVSLPLVTRRIQC